MTTARTYITRSSCMNYYAWYNDRPTEETANQHRLKKERECHGHLHTHTHACMHRERQSGRQTDRDTNERTNETGRERTES